MAADLTEFRNTGQTVAQRLFLISAMRWLNRSVWVVAVVALVTALTLRFLGVTSTAMDLALLITPLVLLVAGVLLARYLQKPGPFQALAAWEEISKGKSVLSSAEFFEGQSEKTLGEKLHLARAHEVLQERLSHLTKDLPMPKPHWSCLVVIPAIALLLTPVLKPTMNLEDLIINPEMQLRAEEEAKRLAEEKEALKDLEALTEEEKEQVNELSELLDDTSEFLADAGSKTSRELLEELEARAREAERMANKLGGDEDEWASEQMLEEMSQHADTSDLAAAIREKAADLSADESEGLAQKLQSDELTTEARTRMSTSLERTMEKATEEDEKKPVGEHVGNASSKLEKEQARPAGQEFRYLADHFRDLSRRERAQEKLKDLADKLRESGNNIAQSQLQQMQQLGGNSNQQQNQNQGQQPPPGMQNLAQSPPMVPQNMGGMQQQPGGQQGMQQPGAQQGMQQAPVPGMNMQQMPQGAQGQQQQMGVGQLGKGQQPGQQGGQALMAPVPGQAPGAGNNPAMMLGSSGNSSMSAPGLQAGFGTAQMGTNTTEAMQTNRDSVVDAQINEDGESVVRTVQGGTRSETAQRGTQEQNVEYLAVEEQALDEKALPVSRKDQVLKYFTALREQFEESN